MVEADRKTWSADYDGIALITGCTILALVKNVALVAAHGAALLKSPARAPNGRRLSLGHRYTGDTEGACGALSVPEHCRLTWAS